MDDIRVVLTLMGIVLHAAGQVAQLPRGLDTFNIWMWIDSAIHVFRMQVFFVISGYFSWKAITKPDYLHKRTRQLLLPGIASWLVICSLIKGHFQPFHPTEGIDFYNVWFIFTLYFLAVGNWILHRFGILPKIIEFAQANSVMALVIAVGLQLLINTARHYADAHFTWTFHFGVPQIVSLTVDYELYFLGGMVLGQTERWKDVLRHPNWTLMGCWAWLMWMWATYLTPSMVNNVLMSTPVTILICVAIMSLATTSNVRINGADKLCSASLTIYLWHYPFIILLDHLIKTHGLVIPDPVMFVGLCVASLGASLLVHRLITQFAILEWMWLGNAWPGVNFINPLANKYRNIA